MWFLYRDFVGDFAWVLAREFKWGFKTKN